jgi:ABC-type transport system substrate-binding protein
VAGTKLTITAVTDSGNPSTTTLAIQDFLSKVGLDIEIHQISSSARSQLVAGDFDMSVQALSIDFPDPWLMFNFAFNSASIRHKRRRDARSDVPRGAAYGASGFTCGPAAANVWQLCEAQGCAEPELQFRDACNP